MSARHVFDSGVGRGLQPTEEAAGLDPEAATHGAAQKNWAMLRDERKLHFASQLSDTALPLHALKLTLESDKGHELPGRHSDRPPSGGPD